MASGDVSGLENMDSRTSELTSGLDMGKLNILFPVWWLFEKNKTQNWQRKRQGREEWKYEVPRQPGLEPSPAPA